MTHISMELDTARERLNGQRTELAAVLRRHRRRCGEGLAVLVLSARRSVRWAAFKLAMLDLADRLHVGSAREELELALVTAAEHRRALERRLRR